LISSSSIVHRQKETLMTEGSMPHVERPKPSRQEGEQEHLREDAGITQEGLGPPGEAPEHLEEDAGQSGQAERKEYDRGLDLIDKVKDKLRGSQARDR
jgi:hypothetical protein